MYGGERTLSESEMQELMLDMGTVGAAGDKASESSKGATFLGGRTMVSLLCSTVNATMGREVGTEMDSQAFIAFVLRVSSKLYPKHTDCIEVAVHKFITEVLIPNAKQIYVEPLRAEVCLRLWCVCVCLRRSSF